MHAVVASPNGRRLWVADARGDYNQSVSLDAGRRLAQQEGLTSADVANAVRARCVVVDRTVERSTFEAATATMTEADTCRGPLLVTALVLRGVLLDPIHVGRSDHLVARLGTSIFVAESCAWDLWDRYYWALPCSPGVGADEKRHMRLISNGQRVTVSHACQPSRMFVGLDLARVFGLAAQCDRRYPREVAALRTKGLAVAGPVAVSNTGRV